MMSHHRSGPKTVKSLISQKVNREFTQTKSNLVHYGVQCCACKEIHALFMCSAFKKLYTENRYKLVTTSHRCYHCLGTHLAACCISRRVCKICGKDSHHSLLHQDYYQSPKSSISSQSPRSVPIMMLPLMNLWCHHCRAMSLMLMIIRLFYWAPSRLRVAPS